MKYWRLFLVAFVVFVGACTPPSPETSPLTSTSPLSAPSNVELTGEEARVVEKLRPLVAEDLGVDSESLVVASIRQRSWSDTSLGCPEPGMVYAQVIVEGWQVVFQDSDGETYDVHTPSDPEDFVICESQEGEEGMIGPSNPAVKAALSLVTENFAVTMDELVVQEASAVQWPNSCLGCAGARENCLMVITPGYRVMLSSGDRIYEVHTNEDGTRARICRPDGKGPLLPTE